MDANENFVITWTSAGQDGDGCGIFARRYNRRGTPLGGEFQVYTYTTSDQQNAAVAMDITGRFVITWDSEGQDGFGTGVYAQIYKPNGNPLGDKFRVNTYTRYFQWNPAVAMDTTGYFIIVWQSLFQESPLLDYEVYGKRYDSNGNPVGSEHQVNTSTTSIQLSPAVAMDGIGRFVVTWSSEFLDGGVHDIFARRYDQRGTPLGNEFRVNTYRPGAHWYPDVAMDSTGRFVIVWQSDEQDGSGFGIFARLYDQNANPLGTEFRVNTYTTGYQVHPSVAMDGNGNLVIAWESYQQDGDSWGIFMNYYLVEFPPYLIHLPLMMKQ